MCREAECIIAYISQTYCMYYVLVNCCGDTSRSVGHQVGTLAGCVQKRNQRLCGLHVLMGFVRGSVVHGNGDATDGPGGVELLVVDVGGGELEGHVLSVDDGPCRAGVDVRVALRGMDLDPGDHGIVAILAVGDGALSDALDVLADELHCRLGHFNKVRSAPWGEAVIELHSQYAHLHVVLINVRPGVHAPRLEVLYCRLQRPAGMGVLLSAWPHTRSYHATVINRNVRHGNIQISLVSSNLWGV
mmetsp:Transcript_11786/g.19164  ORF Transcript_11786/g.19164 Transcript_11786/m.19164 type:complete len:245 (-) Transcript_11786:889-1623(-)